MRLSARSVHHRLAPVRLLAAMVFGVLAAPAALATPFHSVTGRYTIDLPEGWVAVRPLHATPANDVPVTRDGVPMIDVILRPAASTGRFSPVGFIAVETSPANSRSELEYEDGNTPGSWQTQIDPQGKTFQATRRTPVLFWLEHRTDARGWSSPTSIVTLSFSTPGRQFDTYEPALRHIAESFRFDNPGLILPSTALLAVAAAVMWVARRARRPGPV